MPALSRLMRWRELFTLQSRDAFFEPRHALTELIGVAKTGFDGTGPIVEGLEY